MAAECFSFRRLFFYGRGGYSATFQSSMFFSVLEKLTPTLKIFFVVHLESSGVALCAFFVKEVAVVPFRQ